MTIALERLNTLKTQKSYLHTPAHKALKWLDYITSESEERVAGRVQLQGPDDQYSTWREVETYLLPDTPFSTNQDPHDLDSLDRMFRRGMAFSDGANESHITDSTATKSQSGSRPSSASSSNLTNGPETVQPATNGKSSKTRVNGLIQPNPELKSLLNFVVWRTHHDDPTLETSAAYILLTDDPIVQKQASKFGVRSKLLSQLANILARDNSKYGNSVQNTEKSIDAPALTRFDSKLKADEPESDDEEEKIVFDPKQRRKHTPPAQQSSKVIDPDHFGRRPKSSHKMSPPAPAHVTPEPVRAPVDVAPIQTSPPSSRGRRHGPRQNGFNGRGFQNNFQRPPWFQGPRGGGKSSRGRGPNPATWGQRRQVNRPIDPDSYDRPAPMARRGRANPRKLWEPT